MTLIEGDGIGPEISQSVKDIFAAANVRLSSRLPPLLGLDFGMLKKLHRPPSSGSPLMSLPS